MANDRLTLASTASASVSAETSHAMTTSRRASVRVRPTHDCSPLGGLKSAGLRSTVSSPRSAMRTAWLVATSAAA
eukprot:10451944-Alexandrium_andersonii.AAC.1